jgi:hypothetical protein
VPLSQAPTVRPCERSTNSAAVRKDAIETASREASGCPRRNPVPESSAYESTIRARPGRHRWNWGNRRFRQVLP